MSKSTSEHYEVTHYREQRVRIAGATDVIVIGAGHAGLSISYLLGEQDVDHVVLERGEVANSWRNERWESLKLLTPTARIAPFSTRSAIAFISAAVEYHQARES